MKKYYIIILFLSLIWFNSCQDYLDLKPVSSIASTEFYKNTSEVEGGVIAIYDGLQAVVQTEWAIAELQSDNATNRLTEGEWLEFQSMDVKPTNSIISDYWSNNYNVIFRANIVLANLENVANATKKLQFEGEAKFARAISNFNLVRTFGDVPLIDKVIAYDDVSSFDRKPKSDVYALIVSDLVRAVAVLPGRTTASYFGRATKGAAEGMLAKVYLTLKDYASAKTLLDQIKTEGYTLMTTYNSVFYTEKNNEILFAIPFYQDDAADGESFSYYFNQGSYLNCPTNDFISVVDKTNDLRFSTLFLWDPLAGTSGGYKNGKYTGKAVNLLQGNDWIVLRYADVLLMHAEAILGANASTTDASALASFNAVRARAGLTPVTAITKASLMLERRIELGFEDNRLWDLIRFGEAETVMTAFSLKPEPGFAFKATSLLCPIPQREINIFPTMKQNPGY